MTDGTFINGKFYRCRVTSGVQWKRSVKNRTLCLSIPLEVVGGDMVGRRLSRDVYITTGTKDNVIAELSASMGIDVQKTDLTKLPELLEGKEVAAECSIQPKADGKGEYVNFGRMLHVNELIPGSIETEVAEILGNTSTSAPDAEGFNDRY